MSAISFGCSDNREGRCARVDTPVSEAPLNPSEMQPVHPGISAAVPPFALEMADMMVTDVDEVAAEIDEKERGHRRKISLRELLGLDAPLLGDGEDDDEDNRPVGADTTEGEKEKKTKKNKKVSIDLTPYEDQRHAVSGTMPHNMPKTPTTTKNIRPNTLALSVPDVAASSSSSPTGGNTYHLESGRIGSTTTIDCEYWCGVRGCRRSVSKVMYAPLTRKIGVGILLAFVVALVTLSIVAGDAGDDMASAASSAHGEEHGHSTPTGVPSTDTRTTLLTTLSTRTSASTRITTTTSLESTTTQGPTEEWETEHNTTTTTQDPPPTPFSYVADEPITDSLFLAKRSMVRTSMGELVKTYVFLSPDDLPCANRPRGAMLMSLTHPSNLHPEEMVAPVYHIEGCVTLENTFPDHPIPMRRGDEYSLASFVEMTEKLSPPDDSAHVHPVLVTSSCLYGICSENIVAPWDTPVHVGYSMFFNFYPQEKEVRPDPMSTFVPQETTRWAMRVIPRKHIVANVWSGVKVLECLQGEVGE